MILLAFDVDGTLDTSGGPVPFAVLERVKAWALVGVVSPSTNWPRTEHAQLNFAAPELGRVGNLRRLRDAYPQALVRLYVSDNKDWDAAHEAGFCYIEAEEFARGVRP